MANKPALILVATAILPDSASEAGKGFGWARALSKLYALHIITTPTYAGKTAADSRLSGCRFYPVGDDLEGATRVHIYLNYFRWCQQVMPVCREILREHRPIGLHHVTIGGFRLLPRYDRLGIAYTLGPLGGGEAATTSLLLQMKLPPKVLLVELARTPLNQLIRFYPPSRSVLAKARLVIGTTRETATLLSDTTGAKTEVVFPDSLETPPPRDDVIASRQQQTVQLREQFRCVFTGRVVWWKGVHLAVRFIARLCDAGVSCRLDVCGDGPALAALRALANELGVTSEVVFRGMISRADLLQAYRDAHLFTIPSLHESSSSALLDGYASGLPSMTLGIGGTATIATEQTGINTRVEHVDEWLDRSCAEVRAWIADPARWLDACRASVNRASDFTLSQIDNKARELLSPERYS